MQILDYPIPFNPTQTHGNGFQNLTGRAFGRLQVLGLYGRRGINALWLVQCECKKVSVVLRGNLTRGTVKSCGCLRHESRRLTNGESMGGKRTPELAVYKNAKNRCRRIKDARYADYGGRGIEFRYASVEEFIADVGRRPSPQHSIDRIDVNGHYEPGNVRWALPLVQSRNKRNSTFITVKGVTRLMIEVAEETGIGFYTLRFRYKSGYCDRCLLVKGRHTCTHRAQNAS